MVAQCASGAGRARRSAARVLAPGPLSFFFALLVSSCGSAARGPVSLPPSDLISSVLTEGQCAPFEWLPWEGVSERGSMRVPIAIDGITYWYQHDTGADVSYAYGDVPDARAWRQVTREAGRFAWAPRVRLGEVEVDSMWVKRLPERSAVGPTAGTLGLSLLRGRVSVIDYPGRRFCLLRPESFPAELERRTEFVPAELRSGKLFVSVTMGGDTLDGVFFDTGASVFPLSVDLDLWKRLTGRTGEEPDNVRLSASSWGRQIPIIGAPALGTLRVGSVEIERPIVYHTPEHPEFFSAWGIGARGLMGSAPFWDGVVVLDLRGGEERFGVVR